MPRVVPLDLYGGQPAQPTTIADAIAERDRQARAKALGKALEKDDDGRMPNIQSIGQGMAYLGQKAIEGIAARREVDQAEAGRKALGQALLNMVDSQRAGGGGYATNGAPAPGKLPSLAGGSAAMTMPSGSGGEVQSRFADNLRAGGLTNPNGLGAVVAYAQHESKFSPKNIAGAWSDPSESGGAGTSGGILSWRNERLANMRAATAGADDPVAAQASFMLKENPQLTAALQAAKSPEEAHSLMADAWKFAGYNRPGGENAARLATTRAYAGRFGQSAQADLPAPGAQPVSLENGGDGQSFVIPPSPDTPALTAREALERAAATVNAREAPPSPADLPAPGSAPTGFDAMGNSDGYFVPPGEQDAPLQPPPASTAPAGANPDVAALFSGQPMGPAQSFVPPDPAPDPDVPLPPQRPADLSVSTAPMPGAGSDAAPVRPGAPTFADGQVPLPPRRPPELNPADLPAPGAQPTSMPPRTAILAQALQSAGGDLNSNDGGAGSFARSGAMENGPGTGPLSPRVAALARSLDPQAVPPDAATEPGASTAVASPQAGPQVPLSLNGGPSAPLGTPVQMAQAGGAQGAASDARPVASQDPRDAYARAIISSPYASDEMVRWSLGQLGPGNVTHVDLGDRIGILNQRGEMIRSLPKGKEPFVVTGGSSVYDPSQGRGVYTAPKEPDLTPDQRNYAAAREGGYRGDFNSFLQQKSQREAKEVTVTRPDGQKESFMYDPQTNTLRTPEQMGAPAYVPQAPANPYAPGGAGGKPLTEDQAKSAGFANRMAQSHGIVNEVETQGTKGIPQGLSKLPVIGNYLSAPDLQKYNQGKSEFITALLRRESGAAIGKDEFTRYDREFFPQPGDDPGTIAQKRAAREGAIKGTMIGAGPNYAPPAGFATPAAPTRDAPQPPAAASGDGRAPSAPVAVQSPDEVSRLPSGAYYRRTDGAVMRKR